MRPFQFRLQTKLDLSSREEQQIREELQIRILQREQKQRELDEVTSKLDEIETAMKALMAEGFRLEEFLILKNYLPIVRSMRLNKEAELTQAEAAIAETRNVLIEKMKERKILEKLREKEWVAYLTELNKEEQKIIDELAINSHFRK